ncbi:MAG: PilZ domain-containing protein [Anaeromyxobacter sp.]
MERSEWIGKLELVHDALRSGAAVPEAERAWYRRARQELLAAAVAEQNAPVIGDERPRKALRLERAVPVRLGGDGLALDWMTTDLGIGGFAVATSAPLDPDRVTWAELDLPTGRVGARVRVVGAVASGPRMRVSFAFEDPSQAAAAALGDYVLDELLPQIVFWDQVLEKVRY